MSSGVASVGRRFLTLGAGEIISRLFAFSATVYLARTLGASVYGVIAAATTIMLYLAFIADCGIEMLGVREVAEHPETLPSTLPPILGARLLIAFAVMAVTVPAALLLMPRPDGPVLALYTLTLITVALGTRWVHLGLEQAGNASWARIFNECVAAACVLLFVHGSNDLLRVPMAQILGEVLGAVFLFRLLPAAARKFRLELRPSVVTPLLTRSWPLVLHSLLGLAIFNSDFIFLRAMRGSEAVGFYAAAYTLISFFQNLGVAYTMSLIPSITRVRNDASAARTLFDGSMAQVMALGLPVMVGGILVAGPLVALIFGSGYGPSARPLQILLVVIPVALLRNVAQGVLLANERQDLMLHTVAWAAAANVVLNVTLIPLWGMEGAAVATLATELARTVLALRYSGQLGLGMTSIMRFARITVASIVMGVCVWLVADRPVFVSIPIGALGYVGALLAVGVIRLRRGALPALNL